MGNDKPPQLQDGKDYLRWKREVEIWVLGTSAAATKQAALCVLSIKDEKARDFATRLSHTELKKAEGLKYLLAEMDKFYKEDSTQCIFLAIEELEKFRRGKLTMTEYIAEFHRKVNQINELLPAPPPPAVGQEAPPVNPIYHDSIQAYKMLVQADLTPEQVTLVKAAMGKDALSTDNIEECLKRCHGDKVFCGSSSSSSKSESVKIKTEPEDTYYGYESSTDEEEAYYQKNHSNNRKFSGKDRKSGYYNKHKKDPERSKEKYSQKRHGAEKQREYEFNRKDPATGEYERCRICQSVKHFAYNCPHSKDKKVMFQKVDGDFCETVLLVGETFNKALIDTGATSNVCGEIWLNTYLDSLPTNLRKDVKDLKKDMRFRFGDGEAVTSQRCVLLPVHLCDKDLVIETYVVAGGLPFLLSRTCMKEMGVSLDIECDRIAISGKYQDLEVTNSGHYVADLLDRTENVLVNFKSEKDPKKKAIKLHRYFGHPRSKRLVDMVKNSELNDEKLIKELKNLDESCENCVVHKRDTPRPKSSLLTATDFNEVVSMDIKQLSTGDLMLHFIDLFSRFSTTCIVPNKHRDTIISGVFKCWITLFGPAGMFFSDNGGEFVNDDFLEMCESLDINMKTTAANSPWSNGVCERHNGLIAESFDKILEDVKCSPKIALAWATNAKNCLANTFGYSPYTLVFGKNPRIPGLDNIKSVSTLNESVVSMLLADHLNAMYQSRLSFMKANNSEKLRRALRGRVANVETEYYTGDKVFFKKKNQKKWSGPATVIGKDGKQVFIRQGGSMFRVHVTKIVLKSRADRVMETSAKECKDQEEAIPSEKTQVENKKSVSRCEETSDSDSECEMYDQFEEPVPGQAQSSDATENSVEANDVVQPSNISAEDDSVSGEIEPSERDSSFASAVEDFANNTITEDSDAWEPVDFKKNGVLDLAPKDEIRFRSEELTENQWEKATVISSGGRVKSAKNRNIFNLKKNSDDSVHHLPLEKYEVQKKNAEPDSSVMYFEDNHQTCEVFAVHISKERYDEPEIKAAMKAELDSWKKYGVYKEISDSGQKTVSTRWVVTKKGNGYKARLVIRGFEEGLLEHVDSPTSDKCSVRIMLSLAKGYNWKIETMDVKAAFLQSKELDRVVYVKPPRNLKKAGVIWQLEKPAYGLNDSPRNWYNSLKEFLLSLGCVVSKYDPGLFYKREKGKLAGMILLHVDDFLVCGNGSFKEVIKSIMRKYDIHKNIGGSFKYVGVNISQCNDYITMDQFDYCKNVSIVDLEKGRKLQKLSPLTSGEKTSYLSLLGKLSWLSYMTRPDLKFDVYTFARKNKTPCVQDLLDLNGVVSKVYQKKRVRFPRLDLKKKVKMVVFADASFGNLDNKINSSRGYVIFLSTGTEAGCLTWAANKASRVVSSTLEAETLALFDGLNHAELLRGIVAELMFGSDSEEHLISIVAFTDSNQLAQSLYSTKHVSNYKLQRDIENIKQRLVRGIVSEVRWVPTEQMIADPLTKKGADCSKLDYVLETGKIFKI